MTSDTWAYFIPNKGFIAIGTEKQIKELSLKIFQSQMNFLAVNSINEEQKQEIENVR